MGLIVGYVTLPLPELDSSLFLILVFESFHFVPLCLIRFIHVCTYMDHSLYTHLSLIIIYFDRFYIMAIFLFFLFMIATSFATLFFLSGSSEI